MPPRKKIVVKSPILSVANPDSRQAGQAEEVKKSLKEVNQTTNYEHLRTQVNQQINSLFDLLIKEINALDNLKKKTQEELELQERQRKQQEQENNFTLLLTQRKKQAEFDEKLEKERKTFEEEKRKKEAEIKIQKEELDNKEKELENLNIQVESFPQKLEKATTDAKKQISAELKKDFDTEKKLLIQKYESDLKLLQQQITSLQTQIKQQEKEILSSKDEKTKAIEQVKELAVAVIKGKEKEPQFSSEE